MRARRLPRRTRPLRRLTGGAAVFLLAGTGLAHADSQLTLATGAQYSDGNYGDTAKTNAFVVPFSARITFGSWSVQASLPYVTVRGPANLGELLDDSGGRGSNSGSGSSGSDGAGSDDTGSGDGGDDGGSAPLPPVPTAFPDDRSVRGIGDASLSASWSLDALAGSPIYLDLTGRVRFPSGSERDGLGVGATDYFALTEVGFSAGRGGVFVSGGRRFLGNTTAAQRVDGWQAGAGLWVAAGPHVTLGLNYDWRDASLAGGTAPRFIESYLAWRLNDVWKIELNGGVGLSNASADMAAGISFSWRHASGTHRSIR